MLGGRERRARPMDLGPSREPLLENAAILPEVTWIEPIPDPADVTVDRETIRLAFVAALQYLPPRQRAVLILCEVLRWQASEVAELLETSVASVNSALERARATLETTKVTTTDTAALDEPDRELLSRYVAAFEAYDIDALTSLSTRMGRVDASVRPLAHGSRRHLRVVVRPRHRLHRLALAPDRERERLTGIGENNRATP